MKFLEIVVITVPAVIMFAVVMSVITKTTISDFDTYIAVSITGLVSLWIAYYFHKKDTPAQRTWNEKRKETMEEMLDLLEQLSRQIRVGSHYLEKDIATNGYSQQTIETFVNKYQNDLSQITRLRKLIFGRTDRNYNYLTNKEARKFKMLADTLLQYLDMKMKRPQNYQDEIKYLEREHTIKREFETIFKDIKLDDNLIKYGVFKMREDDFKGRWANTHKY